MGFIADKVSRVTAVAMASGLAAAVYLAVFLVDDPTATWVFGLLAVMGIAEISAFVSSQALVGQQAPASRRGAVMMFGVRVKTMQSTPNQPSVEPGPLQSDPKYYLGLIFTPTPNIFRGWYLLVRYLLPIAIVVITVFNLMGI